MSKQLFVWIVVLVFVVSIFSVDGAVYQKPKKSRVSVFDKGVCPSCVSKNVASAKTAVPKVSKKSVPVKQRIRCEDLNVYNPGRHFLDDCSRCPAVSSCTGPVKLSVGTGYVKCFVCKLSSGK